MKNRVITISREFGSGGRTIGKKVAENITSGSPHRHPKADLGTTLLRAEPKSTDDT